MSDRATITKLRDLAADASAKGQHERALECWLRLERLDPDPDWARRAAMALERLGRRKEQVDALNRAAREYTRRGEVMKAVAASKQILALDPRHPETLARLPELRAAFGASRDLPETPAGGLEIERHSAPKGGGEPPPARSKAPGSSSASPDPRAARPAPRPSWLGRQSAGIAALPLRDVVPGATPHNVPTSGIYRIPLQDEVGDEIALELDKPNHMAATRERSFEIDLHGNATTTVSEESAEDLAIAAVEDEFRAAEKANQALAKATLFAELPKKTFGELLLAARLVELADGAELFRQGDQGDALYVIAEGTVGVVDEGPPRRGLAKLGPGDYFGEIALVIDAQRTATIVALEDARLIAIDRAVIHRVIASDPAFLTALLRMLRNRLVDRLLSTNPLFLTLSARDREALKPRFRFLEVDAGAVLLAEGARPEGLVIFLAGTAEVTRAAPTGPILLGELRSGDLCGETALLTGGASMATVRAKTKCLAIELPAAAFGKIVGARPEAMAFIKSLMEQRIAMSRAILSGRATYAEGRLRVV